MVRPPLLLVIALFTLGCASRASRTPSDRDTHPLYRVAPSTAPAPGTLPGPHVISVGQRYEAAQGTARAAGYRLHDGHGLAWASPGPNGHLGVDGFYIYLPADIQLIVFRDDSTNTVGGLHLVGNASKPKAQRTRPPVGAVFELPPEDEEGR